MTTREKIRFVTFRTLGNFLLLLALYGVYQTFSPLVSQELRLRIERVRGISYAVVKEPDTPLINPPDAPLGTPGALNALFAKEKEHILIPIDPLFSILIPKIGASERIIPNVDSGNSDEYKKALLKGVAHAKGTVFPGIPGNTYLFAHSADNWWNAGHYNAVFYLIKDLEKGDEIVVFFEGRRYNYTVSEKYVADPSEVSFLVSSRGEEQKLILQTCWPPGTTWKRLFIIAKPKRT